MALLIEKWPAHTATCSKWRLEAKHGYIRNGKKTQWQPITAMIHLRAVWCHVAGKHNWKQNVTQFVCWGRWCVCAVRHLCYRVTFSQWASIWYVAWWQTNLSNMCACVGGLWKTIRLVAHEKQMTSFVCCCLSDNDPLWLIHSPKGFLEKFDCELNGRQTTLITLSDTYLYLDIRSTLSVLQLGSYFCTLGHHS